MKIANVHIYLSDPSIKEQLNRIEKEIRKQMKTLDDILTEASDQTTLLDSMDTLLAGLQAQITAAGGNQTKIDAVFEAFRANNARVVKSITDNTPVEVPPPPEA